MSRVRWRKWKLHFIFFGDRFLLWRAQQRLTASCKYSQMRTCFNCNLLLTGTERVEESRPDQTRHSTNNFFFSAAQLLCDALLLASRRRWDFAKKKINTIKKEICEVCRACRRTRKSYRDCEHRRDTRRVIIKFNVKNIARHSSQRRLVSETEKSDDVVDVENK